MNMYRMQYHVGRKDEEDAHMGAVSKKRTADVLSIIII